MLDNFVSVPKAAEMLGCTEGRVRQLIYEGTIKAQKINAQAWAVLKSSVEKFGKKPAKSGRPRKFAKPA